MIAPHRSVMRRLGGDTTPEELRAVFGSQLLVRTESYDRCVDILPDSVDVGSSTGRSHAQVDV